jgi:hypothetical protein
MTRDNEENYSVDEELQKVVEKYTREIFDKATITASCNRAESKKME